jgi:hypothetical protein
MSVGLFWGVNIELFMSEIGLLMGEIGLLRGEIGLFMSEIGLFMSEIGLFMSEIGLFMSEIGLLMSEIGLLCAPEICGSRSSGGGEFELTPRLRNRVFIVCQVHLSTPSTKIPERKCAACTDASACVFGVKCTDGVTRW